jgi:uncharacterized phage-associated protein
MELDPRSVANLIILTAKERRKKITNLSLQKILYFVHGRYLIEEGQPLLKGSFEAWQYGPVSLAVYEAFKHLGSQGIETLAERRDIRTGETEPVPLPSDPELCQKIVDLSFPYLSLSAGRLVDLSHARGSPWDRVTRGDHGERHFGLRITNETIEQYFRFHKIAISADPVAGEPNEESPPN